MKYSTFYTIIALLALSGCSIEMPFIDATPTLMGADRNAQACIVSAGYSWCERTQACERNWELSKNKGFENTKENFRLYCKN